MYGANPGGDSGYAINQLIAAARMRFKPIVVHAERAIEQQLATLLDIVEYRIAQTLHVYSTGGSKSGGWIGIGPDDLNGYRMIRVNLNPIMPTDAYARSSKVINEVNARLKSRRTGMERSVSSNRMKKRSGFVGTGSRGRRSSNGRRRR